MKPIPPEIQAPYERLLFDKAIPRMDHPFYKKWLRYYLDFCVKYHYESSSKESLPHFIQKLRYKKQAAHAISLCAGIESNQIGE